MNNRPNEQDISNVDRHTKVHAVVHSDIKGDDDRRTSTTTLPPKVSTDDATPSISQQKEREPDDLASGHRRDSKQLTVRVIPAATDKNEQRSENQVQHLQDSTITSELIQGVIDVPDIMENDYIIDEDFADIYKYIKYDILMTY